MKNIKNKAVKDAGRFVASNGVEVQWAHDPEADMPLSARELAAAEPVDVNAVLSAEHKKALGEFVAHRLRGRPRKTVKKKDIKLRLDPDIIAAYKATGKGWQTRMNEALRGFMPSLAT